MQKFRQPGVSARCGWLRVALGAAALLAVAAAGAAIAGAAFADDAPQDAIKIDNFVFQPKALRVKQGTAVTWTNHDDIPHSIVVQTLKVHSSPMDSDASFAMKFEKAGVYNYICGLHPFMKGQVVVTP